MKYYTAIEIIDYEIPRQMNGIGKYPECGYLATKEYTWYVFTDNWILAKNEAHNTYDTIYRPCETIEEEQGVDASVLLRSRNKIISEDKGMVGSGRERKGSGSSGSTKFNFLRNHQAEFQTACTSLQSNQKWRNVPLSPHPCQHLLAHEFLTLAILTGLR